MQNSLAKTPVAVTDLPALLEARSNARAGIRVARHLVTKPNHRAITAELCREAGVANLSAAVDKVERHLSAMGWEIVAIRPRHPIPNRWQEPSGQFYWQLRPLGGEA